jgi:hypothetical protein
MSVKMSSKIYDQLKFIAQVALPALGTLYFTLAGIWSLPAPEQVVGTIVAVDTFLGVLLHLSTNKYNQSEDKYAGEIVTSETKNKKLYSLELKDSPEKLDTKKEVLFKVRK